jgi:hypothetical protein
MLEEARANEAQSRSIAEGMRRQMQALRLAEPVAAARPEAPDSPSHSPHGKPATAKEPTTPIWLREAASTLGSLAQPEAQPEPTPQETVEGSSGANAQGDRSEVSAEYMKAWLVPYLAQVYGGAARESHAALARVLVSMLQLPPNQAAHLNALLSRDPERPAQPMLAPRPAAPQEEEPSVWNLCACAGPAAVGSGARNLAEEERRLVAKAVSNWW